MFAGVSCLLSLCACCDRGEEDCFPGSLVLGNVSNCEVWSWAVLWSRSVEKSEVFFYICKKLAFLFSCFMNIKMMVL